MKKKCPITQTVTNCTDNCAVCLAEENKYAVKAYLGENFRGLIEDLYTDSLTKVEEFIWKNCNRGLFCELTDRVSGKVKHFSPENFAPEAVDLIDLLLEQLETM